MDNQIQVIEEEEDRLIPTIYVIIGLVVGLAVAAGLIFGVIWLARNYPGEIEVLRDVFIIGLALETCLFGVVLIVATIMLIRLVNTLEFEIKPVLRQTSETINNVRGTTRFVSKNVVQPVSKAGSFVVGVRRGLKVLFGDPRKNLPE